MGPVPINILPAVDVVEPPAVPRWKSILGDIISKIWDIVCLIFNAIALGVLLFINPVIFALSFSFGAIWDNKAQEIVDKIEHLVTKQKVFSGFCLAAGAFVALPVSLAAMSVYGGLRLGIFMNAEILDMGA